MVAARPVDESFVAQCKVQVVLYAQLRKQRQGLLCTSADSLCMVGM